MAQPIPEVLAHLVGLNVKFGVLVCMQCKYAVAPTAISRHLKDKHKAPIELRKQLDEYVQEFPFQYDHASVPLPSNRSAPQPIIPVLDGHLCKGCPYKTQSRDAMKKHGNIAHDKQRVADNELYEVVQLQSWFDDRRAQYWIVDKSKQAGQPGDVDIASSQTGVEEGVGAEEEEERRDVSEIGVEGGNKKEDVIDQGVAGFHNRSIIVDDTKDVEEADRTIEVGSDEEGEDEVSADDTEDEDYIEEAAEDASEDADKSEDEDYVEEEEVGEGSDDEDYSVGKGGEVSSGESEEGDAESVEDKEITVGSSDEESVEETIEVDVGEHDVVPIVMIGVDEDMASEIGTDDSKDEDYSEGESCGTVVQASEGEPGSGFESASQESPTQVPRGKRGWLSGVQRKPVKMHRFEDSGVIMGSSEGDRRVKQSSASGLSSDAVMRSSPPVIDWQLGGGTSHGRHVEELTQPTSDPFSSDPFSRPPVSMSAVQLVSAASSAVSSPVSSPGDDVQFGQMDDNEPHQRLPSTGEGPQVRELMEYLEQWSGVCPLCYLVGRARDKEHNIKECTKDKREEIAKAIVAREEGLQEIGAFKKIGCCGSCGLPTAICESQRCPRGEGGDRQCRYKGVIIPAVVTMLTKEGCREGVEVLACWFERGGVDQQKSIEVDEWFGREIEWNGLKIVQVVRVFYMLARKNAWWMRCRKPQV
jgi:Orsellinic acid/F9775 biosynthesis cluster protein D